LKVVRRMAIFLLSLQFSSLFANPEIQTINNAKPVNTNSLMKDSATDPFEGSINDLLSTVTIAAKKKETPLTASGTVYVITEKDIERYGWRDMKEILAAIPNMDLVWNWNWLNGGQRGFTGNFSGTLLMIDGREVQNLFAGEAYMTNNFPSYRIKRVEVLQGPNSTLYGGNATQGIINIITKFGDKNKSDVSQIEFIKGEVETEQVAIVYKENHSDYEIGASASYFSSDQDFDELKNFVNDKNLYSRNPTHDPYRVTDFTNHTFYNAEKAWTVDVFARYKFLHIGYNYFDQRSANGIENVKYDYSGNESRRASRQFFAGINYNFLKDVSLLIEYKNVKESASWIVQTLKSVDFENFDKTYDQNQKDAMRKILDSIKGKCLGTPIDETCHFVDIGGTIQDDIKQDSITSELSLHINNLFSLIGGYKWSKTEIADRFGQKDTVYPNKNDKNKEKNWMSAARQDDHSLFIQNIANISEWLKLTTGIRFTYIDYKNEYKDYAWLPRASLVLMPHNSSAIKFTYGKAFRAPAHFERKGKAIEVDPEIMHMFEINYSQKLTADKISILNSLSIYQMTNTNMLSSVFDNNIEKSNNDRRKANPKIDEDTLPTPWIVKTSSHSVKGVEDYLKFNISSFSGFLGGRYIIPDKSIMNEQAKDSTLKQEFKANVPKYKIKAGLSYYLYGINAALFIDHWSKVDTITNNIEGTTIDNIDKKKEKMVQEVKYTVDGFTTININIGGKYEISPGVLVSLSLYAENIFNTGYYHANVRGATPVQYMQAPRNFRGRLTLSF